MVRRYDSRWITVGLASCVFLVVDDANAANRIKVTSGELLRESEVTFQCADADCRYVVDLIVDGMPHKAGLNLRIVGRLATLSVDGTGLTVRLNGEPQTVMSLDERGFGRRSFELTEPLSSGETEKPNSAIQAVVRAPKRRLGGITVEIVPVP